MLFMLIKTRTTTVKKLPKDLKSVLGCCQKSKFSRGRINDSTNVVCLALKRATRIFFCTLKLGGYKGEETLCAPR